MSGHAHLTPAQIRAKLNHPVVDGDGHWVEYDPVFSEQMRKVGGDLAADGFLAAMAVTRDSLLLSVEERRRRRVSMPGFWTRQTGNTYDRATAMMPHLLYERLDEIGSDFAIIYPTAGLRLPRIKDDATRRAVIRAYNIVSAEYFKDLQDRMTPAAIGQNPDIDRLAVWYEVFGIDSIYDYDPVWEKCREVKIAPTFHSAGSNQALRNSPTNFTYNHIGHFADAGHAAAKGIFLGGVTRRFPELRFAFLEGGVGWGAQLFGDLMEHWERRNLKALDNMRPEKLDRELLMGLVEKYGYKEHAAALQERDGWPDPELHLTGGLDDLDDFGACKITKKQDWIDLYATPYYFGCEADDRMNATAFLKLNPFGAQLNAIYSSDIGHFDVIDMREPLPEAYELVEDGVLTERNFRDFVFANAVRLWGTQNPRFFEGTRVAKEATAVLQAAQQPAFQDAAK
ncbi:MAG: hypothetical protein AUG92_01105 [Alphaproteobacteria bacterium 13_1_20CM_4_65_11]|nr:MAG: hypothetical protein AUG92_01105 [Alphaproteobacteria bacterium 13_1_20CM_4_65_11]